MAGTFHTRQVMGRDGPPINPRAGGEFCGLLPNARLLVHRQELASVAGLLPTQADWYCPEGLQGVAPERIVPFDGSVRPSAASYRLSTTVTQYGGCSAARYSADLVAATAPGSAVAAESPWVMGAVTYFFSVMILVG